MYWNASEKLLSADREALMMRFMISLYRIHNTPKVSASHLWLLLYRVAIHHTYSDKAFQDNDVWIFLPGAFLKSKHLLVINTYTITRGCIQTFHTANKYSCKCPRITENSIVSFRSLFKSCYTEYCAKF